jgi:hypothetical protein
MIVEKVHNGIRYTLSNEDLKVGDKVFPLASGRCESDTDWILHEITFNELHTGFPASTHTILNLKHSDYKPYEVQTNYGYSPKEVYFKIIKIEERVKVKDDMFGGVYEWKTINEN